MKCFLPSEAPTLTQECVSALQLSQTKFGLCSLRAVLHLSVCLHLHTDSQSGSQSVSQSVRITDRKQLWITGRFFECSLLCELSLQLWSRFFLLLWFILKCVLSHCLNSLFGEGLSVRCRLSSSLRLFLSF